MAWPALVTSVCDKHSRTNSEREGRGAGSERERERKLRHLFCFNFEIWIESRRSSIFMRLFLCVTEHLLLLIIFDGFAQPF